MSIDKIYLDVDGVIADFTKAAFTLFRREDLINKQQGYDIAGMLRISSEEFWKHVDHPIFWALI